MNSSVEFAAHVYSNVPASQSLCRLFFLNLRKTPSRLPALGLVAIIAREVGR